MYDELCLCLAGDKQRGSINSLYAFCVLLKSCVLISVLCVRLFCLLQGEAPSGHP